MAHRGFSLSGAENTLTAFQAAWDLGCLWLELDVNTTSDGVVMVFHDGSLDRVTDGSGQVGDHTHAQIMELSVAGGECPLTLAHLLEELPELAELASGTAGLRLAGLMAVPPIGVDPAAAFGRLAALGQELRRQHPGAAGLSAGMSPDLEAAIAQGSTCVRVGTAILGARPIASQ